MQSPWFSVAGYFKGLSEVRGSVTNPKIAEMFRISGHPEIKDDETPWCAAFIGAMLADCGIAGSHKALARSYETWGEAVMTGEAAMRWASIPLGAIVVLNRPSAGPTKGHVGFAVGAAEKHVELIGGNQNDSVSRAWFPKTRIVAVRWPKGEPASEYLLWGAAPRRAGRTRTG